MERSLEGKRVAVLMTDGVEQSEYEQPRQFLEDRGAHVEVVGPKARGEKIQAFNSLSPGATFTVDVAIDDAKPEDYELLVLPGGVVNPDRLRLNPQVVEFVSRFGRTGRPLAAICHGPWLLINAGLIAGHHVTSWPSLQADVQNAGGEWIDEPVVVDGQLITSRKPADIPVFNAQIEQSLRAPHAVLAES